MAELYLVLLFVIGLSLGSFCNVVIARRNLLESILKGRSACPDCNTELSAIELIPVVSFVLLSGRCKNCDKPISFIYPIVELLSGIIVLLLAVYFVPSTALGWLSFMFLILGVLLFLALSVIDLFDQSYPSTLLWLSGVIGVLFALVLRLASTGSLGWLTAGSESLIGGVTAIIILGGLFLITNRKGIGDGDIVIGAIMGIMLGYPAILLLLALAFIIGGVVAVLLLVFKTKRFGEAVPFGPFLFVAFLIMLLFGNHLLQWFVG